MMEEMYARRPGTDGAATVRVGRSLYVPSNVDLLEVLNSRTRCKGWPITGWDSLRCKNRKESSKTQGWPLSDAAKVKLQRSALTNWAKYCFAGVSQ